MYTVAVATIVLLLALRLLSLLRGVVCDFCGTSALKHADVALQLFDLVCPEPEPLQGFTGRADGG